MIIYFLRHCESVFNKFGLDLIDCNLTEHGKKQAGKIKGHYDIIITSPMKRTKNTLKFSKLTFDELIENDLCREYKIDVSDFLEGEDIVFEREEELDNRIKMFKQFLINRVIGKNINKKILVITHSDFVYHLTSKQIHLKNGEICEFEIEIDNSNKSISL